MRTDRNAVAAELAHRLGQRAAAFQLDDLRAAFLHQSGGVAHRLVDRGVAGERHVGHQQRSLATPRRRLGVIDHLFHRDRHGGALALDDHAQRIADQDDLHTCRSSNAAKLAS